MIGCIVGDIIGSPYERENCKRTDFPLFTPTSRITDDSVLCCAVASWLMDGGNLPAVLRRWWRHYPEAGYGRRFDAWAGSDAIAGYGSWGNGSAMRVAPVGWAARSEGEVLRLAEESARATHDHPEGIKGAQAVALAIWLFRQGAEAEGVRRELSRRFNYDLARSCDGIRPGYRFDLSCAGSVPEAIIAALEGDSVEGVIRLAVSLGGDSDTIAAIAGGISEARFVGVPGALVRRALECLDARMRGVVERFTERFQSPPFFTDI